LTDENRLTAVPQLLNLLDDDSLEPATQDLVCASLQSITGASFGKDPDAWREWWAHHDRPDRTHHGPKRLLLAEYELTVPITQTHHPKVKNILTLPRRIRKNDLRPPISHPTYLSH